MDSNKITIFIAGSTHSSWVKETKSAISLLQIEMRGELEKTYNTTLLCIDCDNPAADNNQAIYNHQIKEESDVFVLLIDSVPVGPYSMEELIRACIYKEQQNHPKVYVFFTKDLKDDPYVADLRNVIKSMTGRYSDFFEDSADIKKKMSDVVRKIAREKKELAAMLRKAEEEELLQEQQTKADNRKQQNRQRLSHLLLSVLAILLVGSVGLGSYMFARHKNAAPIFFAGGGSVRSFLDSAKVNIANRADGIYIHIPTGDSWVMLGEEQKIDEITRNGERKYYPLILAADDIHDNMKALKIEDEVEFLRKVGHIADINIGEDPLIVTVPRDPLKLAPLRPFLHHLDKGTITASELADILCHFEGTDSITVYHTTSTSGTVATYQKAMMKASDKIDETTMWCWNRSDYTGHTDYNNKTTLLSDVIKTPFIVLESQYYHITGSLEDSNTQPLRIIDTNNKQLFKPLHLYFIMRRITDSKDNFEIEEPIYNFLVEAKKALNLDFELKRNYTNVTSNDIVYTINPPHQHE